MFEVLKEARWQHVVGQKAIYIFKKPNASIVSVRGNLEDAYSKFLQNVGTFYTNYTASHPIVLQASTFWFV
jgi:hypothetical protein